MSRWPVGLIKAFMFIDGKRGEAFNGEAIFNIFLFPIHFLPGGLPEWVSFLANGGEVPFLIGHICL